MPHNNIVALSRNIIEERLQCTPNIQIRRFNVPTELKGFSVVTAHLRSASGAGEAEMGGNGAGFMN